MSGWLDGYGPAPQPLANPPRPEVSRTTAPAVIAAAWSKGQRRIMIEALCCEECGNLKLRRREEYGTIAYWQCERCSHRQKDDKDAGRDRAHLA